MIKLIISDKRINEGEQMPKWYGVAYRDFAMYQAVCYPIPLNIIVATWNKVLWWLTQPSTLYNNDVTDSRSLHKTYSDGYLSGLRAGQAEKQSAVNDAFADGRRAAYDELERELNKR